MPFQRKTNKFFNHQHFATKTFCHKRQCATRRFSSLIFLLEKLLDKKGFFVPVEKKHSMLLNINNLFYRLEPNDKELRILASIISSLSKKNINHN